MITYKADARYFKLSETDNWIELFQRMGWKAKHDTNEHAIYITVSKNDKVKPYHFIGVTEVMR